MSEGRPSASDPGVGTKVIYRSMELDLSRRASFGATRRPGMVGRDGRRGSVSVSFGLLLLGLAGNPLVPFVPTREEAMNLVFALAKPTEADVFYDLGCGDGRVVIEAVKRFNVKKAVCIEKREDLVKLAYRRVKEEGLEDRVKVIHGDFMYTPIHEATIVYMYLLTSVNEALKPKLKRELRIGARIVTLDFEIPGWRPVAVLGERHGWQKIAYLYVRGISDM